MAKSPERKERMETPTAASMRLSSRSLLFQLYRTMMEMIEKRAGMEGIIIVIYLGTGQDRVNCFAPSF